MKEGRYKAQFVRITARVSERDYQLIKKYAGEYGVTMSQFSGLCVRAGMQSLLRAIAPEEALSAAKWAEIVTEMKKVANLSGLPGEDEGKQVLDQLTQGEGS